MFDFYVRSLPRRVQRDGNKWKIITLTTCIECTFYHADLCILSLEHQLSSSKGSYPLTEPTMYQKYSKTNVSILTMYSQIVFIFLVLLHQTWDGSIHGSFQLPWFVWQYTYSVKFRPKILIFALFLDYQCVETLDSPHFHNTG